MTAAVVPEPAARDITTGDRALRGRQQRGRLARGLFLAATLFGVAVLLVLLASIASRGYSWLSWGLLSHKASKHVEEAGLQSALLGTLWIIGLTAIVALPIGIGAAVYLEEYAPRNWWTKILQVNISNLAGVPSVVYGLLGLAVFVDVLGMGRSIIAGALTMALLIMPVIIIASQESIRAVPLSLRQGAFALGATRWQVARHHVLPVAMPGILTGTILALSRAFGETAPLLVVGAAGFVTFNPDSITSKFTVLPIQIFYWTGRPGTEFKDLAAAGIIVLLVVLLLMNGIAIGLRQRFRRARW